MRGRLARFWILACLSLVAMAAPAAGSAQPSVLPIAPAAFVWFEENTGQAADNVAFIGHGFGIPLALLKDGSLAVDAGARAAILEPRRAAALPLALGESPTGGVTRFYLPGGPFVSRHFQQVRFAGMWPGADLFYRITQGRLELGLEVAPGRTGPAPALRWRGARARIGPDGRLLVRTGELQFTLDQPAAYQSLPGGTERQLAARYRLSRAGTLRFQVDRADSAAPLTIDPTFDFSTYLGGSQLDAINGMALGPDGSIYLTGQTGSPTLFGQSTGIQTGAVKALVLRLAPGGVGVVFYAVIGGSYSDQGQAIAVDAGGNAYVAGYTDSPDFFTTPGTFQTTSPPDWNAFAVKIDPAGDLLYSTFLGGSGPDRGLAIAVDGSFRAIVAGQTSSADYPVTASAYQKTIGGADDCFVTMISADATAAVFSTFLGGSALDGCHAVAVDGSGTVIVAGATRSTNFPVVGAFQNVNGGFLDGFVAQLSSDGSQLLSSSYLGGIGQDQVAALALDAGGSVYVAGSTSEATGFPGSASGVVNVKGSGTKAFACQISPGLVALEWCSMLGGSGTDSASALALLPTGEVAVGGQTTSSDLPLQGALQTTLQGAADGWFAVLAAGGKPWETVSYTGGAGVSTVAAMQAFQDRVLLAGSTTATNLSVTSGAIQSAAGGNGDGFLQEVAISGDMVLNGIYPPGGTGLNQALSLVVSDPAGAQAVQMVQVNVSNPYSSANACAVTVSIAANTVSLADDSGSGTAGSATLGGSGTLYNSQCTLSVASSNLTLLGNTVAVHLSLTYAAAFADLGGGVTKYVNVFASDNQGNVLSVMNAASWAVTPPQAPVAVSVSPSSGQGLAQSFALTVSDSSGANDLSSVLLLFANSTSLGGACAVTYNAQQKTMALANDAGTGPAGAVTPGQAGSVSNSQCTLNGSGSSIQTSGTTLVMTANLQFTTAFAVSGTSATKTIYGKPVNSAGQGPTGGTTALGSWTVPKPGAPTVVSLSPSSGQGLAQSFALTVSDTSGAGDLSAVQLLFGNSTNAAAACSVTYTAQTGALALANDAGTGPAGSVMPGQAASVSNSQCTLTGSGSSIQNSGNTLVMTVNLQFAAVFAKTGSSALKTAYANPVNSAGQGPTGGMVAAGTWIIPSPPAVVSVSPSSGQGTSQAFALTVSDAAGAGDLASVQLLVGNSTSTASACSVTYTAQSKTLALANDAGTGAAGNVTPGQAATVSNSQCTLNGSGSSIQTSGNTLVMTVNLQFALAFAKTGTSATKNIYGNPVNSAGQGPSGGMITSGTWTVAASGVPALVSLTPASGRGQTQAFTLTVSDAGGAGDLASVQLLIGNSTSLNGACAVTYAAQQKVMSLTNDAGTAYAGSVTPGQAGSVSNSRCTLTGGGSAARTSGNSLIITANLQFKAAFAAASAGGAAKKTYATALNKAGTGPSGGMKALGTWTIAFPPSIVGVSPASGTGSSSKFTLTVSDAAGAADLATTQIIFSTSVSLAKACAILYVSSQQALGLYNDLGTGYTATTPGAKTSISNSQCTLNAGASSVQTSGNNLSLTVSVQFKPAFKTAGGSATKIIYGNAVTAEGLAPAQWASVGTWTTQ